MLVQSEDASCEAASKGNSAALLQAAANRTEVEQVVEQGDDIQERWINEPVLLPPESTRDVMSCP